MPKVGGRRKKVRSHKEIDTEFESELPKTFVIKKGKCSKQLQETVIDLRKCFYPNTAMKLEDTNKMSIKSYLKAAKYYNVTHLIALQQSKEKNYIRFIKVGAGEMTFRIVNYCRMRDVLQHGGQPFSYSFREPLIVLNNFSETSQLKMIGKSLQELFPPINLEKTKAQKMKRVISFTYNANKKFIYFRQYKINVHEAGVSTTFEKLMKQGSVDLSAYRNISEFLKKNQFGTVQGSEAQQKVKLVEMGPRMKLKFISYKEHAGEVEDFQEDQPQNRQNNENNQNLNENQNENDIENEDN